MYGPRQERMNRGGRLCGSSEVFTRSPNALCVEEPGTFALFFADHKLGHLSSMGVDAMRKRYRLFLLLSLVPAFLLGSVFAGAPGAREREHWEFSFDSRSTNLTWSWRRVCAKGRAIGRSAAFADLRLAVNDAVGRGFLPGSGDWVVRGMPMTARPVARQRAVAQ